MPDTDAPSPPDGTAVRTLRSARDEARTTLDHQLSRVNDIDDKAVRTVRIALFAVSLLVSASTFASTRRFVNVFTVSGLLSLGLAIIVGVSTYSSTNPEAGVSSGYVAETLDAPYSEKEWLSILLAGYHEWIEEMRRLNRNNARLLLLARACTALGVVLVALGVALATVGVPPLTNLPG